MVSRRRVYPFLLLWLTTVTDAADVQFLQGMADTRYHRVEAPLIGRDFHIYVKLPGSYEENDQHRYPTIYVLDGGELFPMFAAYSRYLTASEEIPECIIVGISYGSDNYGNGNYRSTDFTAPSAEREHYGGAAGFQQFLATTLIPTIEEHYRSRPDRRIIFGHSLGGQFVLHAAQTAPELFWGYLASNPALHRNLEFFLTTVADEYGHLSSRLFVANGSENDRRFQIPALEWVNHWEAVENRPWYLKTVELKGHTHMSTPPIVFRDGMNWLFND